MTVAARVIAGLVGVGLLALVVDAAVAAAGGYGMPAARLMIGLAAGVAAGSLAVGLAWEEGRRRLALCLVVALLAGEAWALLQTAERTIAHREQQQAPLRAAGEARDKATQAVRAAEASLAGIGETPRLVRAEAAKKVADAAVVAKAAEKGCAANCRQLLQGQADAAAAEVAAARAEVEIIRASAEGRLKQARAYLTGLPLPPSATPLADRLGIQGWRLDLAHAALASMAANGLAAFLLAFAAHGRQRRPSVIDIAPVPLVEAVTRSDPVATVAAHVGAPSARNANNEADLFARTTLRPAERGRVKLAEIPAAYAGWCRARGLDPLPQRDIGAALAALFSSVGLYKRGSGARAVVPGIEWKSRGPVRIEGPESNAASP